MEKILIIRFSSLGDLVLLSGIFREVKKRYPGCELTFLTSLEYSGIFVNNPCIDRIIPFDRRNSSVKELWTLLKKLNRERFTVIFDFHKLLRSAIIALGLKLYRPLSVKIYGYNKRNSIRYLNVWLKHKPETHQKQCEAYHLLLDKAKPGFSVDYSTELYPGEEDREMIRSLIGKKAEGHLIVGICPGAAFESKKWFGEYYTELVNKLNTDNVFTILIGGKDDKECDLIEQNAKKPELLTNLGGKLDCLQSACALSFCKVAVSNDSAAGHLAESVKTPVLVIFGATVNEFGYGPYLPASQIVDTDLSCRPCSTSGKKACVNPIFKQCFKDISPQMVYERVKLMLR